MKASKQDLIDLLLKWTDESLTMAKLAIDANFWNSAASELYYSFFYFIQVLFTMEEMDAQTHKGVKVRFAEFFIKTQRLDEKWGKIFSRLFNHRQEGDYGNFNLTSDTVLPLLKAVEEFRVVVFTLLEQAGYKTNNES